MSVANLSPTSTLSKFGPRKQIHEPALWPFDNSTSIQQTTATTWLTKQTTIPTSTTSTKHTQITITKDHPPPAKIRLRIKDISQKFFEAIIPDYMNQIFIDMDWTITCVDTSAYNIVHILTPKISFPRWYWTTWISIRHQYILTSFYDKIVPRPPHYQYLRRNRKRQRVAFHHNDKRWAKQTMISTLALNPI